MLAVGSDLHLQIVHDLAHTRDLRGELLRLIYVCGLLERLASGKPAIKDPADVHDLLTYGIVLLPGAVDAPQRALARAPAVAELQVVRETLRRYEMGEVAHIENVLIGESKERTHRRATVVEEVEARETERTTEEERDLQTSEQYELQRESSQILSEDSTLETGLTVTASYGPTVPATANLGYQSNTAREESSRTATWFAGVVWLRATCRLSESIRVGRLRRTTTEVEELNRHEIDNSERDAHVVGIYRWVDKVYEAQVFTYGKRLLLEFVVPEPAAFLAYARSASEKPDVDLEDPAKPMNPSNADEPLAPDHIVPENYLQLVEQYDIAGAEPPPEPVRFVASALEQAQQAGRHRRTALWRRRRSRSLRDTARSHGARPFKHGETRSSTLPVIAFLYR